MIVMMVSEIRGALMKNCYLVVNLHDLVITWMAMVIVMIVRMEME